MSNSKGTEDKPSFEVIVYNGRSVAWQKHFDSLLEVGREDIKRRDPPPISDYQADGHSRLVIASKEAVAVPRRWMEINSHPEGVVLRNVHSQLSLCVGPNDYLAPQSERIIEHETQLFLDDDCSIRIRPELDFQQDEAYRSLLSVPPIPGETIVGNEARSVRQFAADHPDDIAKFLRLALQVVQQSASGDSFFEAAASATTQIVELDRTVLLIRSDQQTAQNLTDKPARQIDEWTVMAEHLSPELGGGSGGSISRSLLRRVKETGTTIVHDPTLSSDPQLQAQSLVRTERAVAAPIMDRNRQVIGVLYADRSRVNTQTLGEGITDLEATLIEILAGAVAGGIARRAEERLRTTLSGFFSPKVVNLLSQNPELMAGQETQITSLFCDIRGFSAASEVLGPKRTFEWLNSVFTQLSQCVIGAEGVVVDYIGDEMLAIWGSPSQQPDHALLSIQAAQTMLGEIKKLQQQWSELPKKFDAGIGLNSGMACVGECWLRTTFQIWASR